MKKNLISIALASICFGISPIFAQDEDKNSPTEDVNVDDLGNNDDEFQEYFFKAIAERAIENQDKAIQSLQKCLELEENNPAVFFELAKNYFDLKSYNQAEDYLLKTLESEKFAENINIHRQLFDLYSETKNYEKAIQKAEYLSEKDVYYFQELANLYLIQNEFQKALKALDDYDNREGIDEFRDDFRMIIYKESENFQSGIDYFQKRISQSEEDTRAYINLMRLFRKENQNEEAIKVGKNLEKIDAQVPELYSELALNFIATSNLEGAKKYSKKVVQSLTLEEKDKVEVIKAFKDFAVENTAAQSAFVEVLDSAMASEKATSSKAELGEFYKSRDKGKALDNYRQALRNKPNDFKLIKNIIQLETELQEFEALLETSTKALELFPSQPILFYSKGLALSNLGETEQAIQTLEDGVDYIIDNESLKLKFYKELAVAFQELGRTDQAENYQQKINEMTE
ncbi:MAG: tetratricopeptide repeat protein [Psychroflexus sp.]